MRTILETFGIIGLGVGAVITIFVVINALLAWPLMLGIGALHSVVPAVPAVGFWPVVGIIVAVRVVRAVLFPSRSSSSQT